MRCPKNCSAPRLLSCALAFTRKHGLIVAGRTFVVLVRGDREWQTQRTLQLLFCDAFAPFY